jgi:hypothetical protein
MKYEVQKVDEVIRKVNMEFEPEEVAKEVELVCKEIGTVSYTHLTLPTIA